MGSAGFAAGVARTKPPMVALARQVAYARREGTGQGGKGTGAGALLCPPVKDPWLVPRHSPGPVSLSNKLLAEELKICFSIALSYTPCYSPINNTICK